MPFSGTVCVSWHQKGKLTTNHSTF